MRHFILLLVLAATFLPTSSHTATIDEQLNLADSLWNSRQPDSALTIALPILNQAKSQSESDSVVADILYRMGRYCISSRAYDSAQSYLHKSLVIRQKMTGEIRQDLATTLYYLGAAYLLSEDYDIAEPFLEQALSQRESLFGNQHIEVGRALIAYSNIKKRLEKYSEAERAARRANQIFEMELPEGSYERYKPLQNLGDIYQLTARPVLAAEYYKKTNDILKGSIGADHPTTATAEARLAKVLYVIGHLGQAEQLYERAISKLEAHYGADDIIVAAENVNLGLVLMARGDFTRASELFQESLEIFRKSSGKQSRWIVNCLRYLAEASIGLGTEDVAESFLREALNSAKNILSDNHSEVARTASSLADFLRTRKRFSEADSLYRNAISVSNEVFEGTNAYTVRSYNGLGLSLLIQGRLDESELFFSVALEVVKQTFGPNHPERAKILGYLAANSRAKGDHLNSLRLFHDATDIRIHNMNLLAPVLAETDALMYSQFTRETVNGYLSSFFDGKIDSEETLNSLAQVILQVKGPVSDVVFLRNRLWKVQGDSALQSLLDDYREARRKLAEKFVAGPGSGESKAHGEMLEFLSKETQRLETRLARKGANLSKLIRPDSISISDIISNLSKESTLIEYLRFSYSHLTDWPDEDHYLALVLDRNGVKTITDLGPAAIIDTAAHDYRLHLSIIESQLAPPSSGELDIYLTTANKLRKLVVDPIRKFVGDSTSLIFALDGTLNLVSFAGLPTGNGKYLIEEHPIRYVSAGRDLVTTGTGLEVSNTGLLAIGDVDFDASPQTRAKLQTKTIDTHPKLPRRLNIECDLLLSQPLTRIPGTRREVEDLVSSWQEKHSSPVRAYYGADATEDVVKKYGPNSKFLHLATHGYFADEICDETKRNQHPGMETFIARSSPLLYSGLYLAGANLRGLGSEEMGLDDGILTAEEVSALNLNGCQMVVLSACESGLGDVVAGEGVYGLRRAFQMAGAQIVVSSLWKIPDATTARFMKNLYNRSDLSVAETLRNTSLRELKRLRRKGQPDHPFNWAAFVAVGVSQ